MFVTELVDFVNSFVFGRSNPTEEERILYLRCLNLADNVLFRCVKNSRRFLQELDLFFPLAIAPDAGINYTTLPFNYIAEVYANNIKLETADYLYTSRTIENNKYYFLNNNIYVNRQNLPSKLDPNDGNIKPYVKLIMIPLRKMLVEIINDANLEINVPIYPESYHLALVHGAIYFLFLSNKGYTEKIQHALRDWQEAKSDLTAYYSQDK